MGHNPTVVTYEPNYDSDDFEVLTDKINVKRYFHRTIPVIVLRHTSSADAAEVFHEPIEEAADKLSLDCDLIHVCHPKWLSSMVKRYGERSKPMIMTLTDAWLLCPAGLLDRGLNLCNGPVADGGCSNCSVGARMAPRLEQARAVYDMADQLTAPSYFIPALFERNGWRRNIKVIRHGVNYADIKNVKNPAPQEVTFGFVGSVIWHKGVHVLVEAARKVARRDMRVKIYGSHFENWSYFNALQELAGDDERIEFLGFFEDEEMPRIMSSLSALVIPSTYYENYPLTMITALAYRVPLIVSDIGGMREVIRSGVNGFTFQIGNSNELANIMENIVTHPEILQNIRKNIEQPRRIEEEALDYENMYRQLT
jgi:glycosyltransferase involved in cell wall biosynthesis